MNRARLPIRHHHARRLHARDRQAAPVGQLESQKNYVRQFALDAGASEMQARATVGVWLQLAPEMRDEGLRQMALRYKERHERCVGVRMTCELTVTNREQAGRALQSALAAMPRGEALCPVCLEHLANVDAMQFGGFCSDECCARWEAWNAEKDGDKP